MADVHNEDMIIDLNSALSKVREALDTTVKIEQNPSMSTSDRNSNIAIVKAAVTNAISVLQNCGSENFLGTASPAPQITTLNVIGAGTFVAGSGNVTLLAAADFMDHNGVVTSSGEKVTVVWASSDSSIGSVNSSSGIFTPLAPGNITISARHSNGSISSVPMIIT
jgi:predicted deacylase